MAFLFWRMNSERMSVAFNEKFSFIKKVVKRGEFIKREDRKYGLPNIQAVNFQAIFLKPLHR